jgi:hypothetical protein
LAFIQLDEYPARLYHWEMGNLKHETLPTEQEKRPWTNEAFINSRVQHRRDRIESTRWRSGGETHRADGWRNEGERASECKPESGLMDIT